MQTIQTKAIGYKTQTDRDAAMAFSADEMMLPAKRFRYRHFTKESGALNFGACKSFIRVMSKGRSSTIGAMHRLRERVRDEVEYFAESKARANAIDLVISIFGDDARNRFETCAAVNAILDGRIAYNAPANLRDSIYAWAAYDLNRFGCITTETMTFSRGASEEEIIRALTQISL